MFTPEQLAVIKYCAEECERQGSGEPSVSWMINAWDHANWHRDVDNKLYPLTVEFIKHLGTLAEPKKNEEGFRTHNVGITDWNSPFGVKDIGSDWHEVERHLQTLLDAYYENVLEFGSAKETKNISKSIEDEFYFLYESIHPFGDGNGRTGKILYNYLLDSMDNPVLPPNFFGSSNP